VFSLLFYGTQPQIVIGPPHREKLLSASKSKGPPEADFDYTVYGPTWSWYKVGVELYPRTQGRAAACTFILVADSVLRLADRLANGGNTIVA
jgi:hypothetical protein